MLTLATIQRLDKLGLIDHRASARIDDDHAILHLFEFGAANEMRGLRGKWGHEHDHVRSCEEVVEGDVVVGAFLCASTIRTTSHDQPTVFHHSSGDWFSPSLPNLDL